VAETYRVGFRHNMPADERGGSAMSNQGLKLTFDAVYYHVNDMEESIAFYRDGV
jgi:hypothetical protein